jgi:hypothetical protein
MVFAGQYGWHRDELYNLASEPVIVFDQEDPHAVSFQHPPLLSSVPSRNQELENCQGGAPCGLMPPYSSPPS